MNKKLLLGILLVFFIMIPTTFAWSLFEEPIEENTQHTYITHIETEWANYSDGYYGYNFDFDIYKLSSSHEIQSVVSYYDSNGKIIKNDNLSGERNGSITQGEVRDNITIKLEDYEKSYLNSPSHIWGGIDKFDYCEIDHIKIDLIDVSEDKLICTINQTFNMSNLWDPHDTTLEEISYETNDDNSKINKTNYDYEFFNETDYNNDGLIDFDEFSEISYIFTEDSFWDGYSIEEVLQSEWDQANSDGDKYLSFEEFKTII